ncbi:borneol dehydrogenase, mitochondrial-like isoform X2 [Nymphaea colorata]|nr:borneol dehydrogenase, mitochondrial-like isoform X1 [Nymphaea colorata]XP_049932208.1 borneol dehydrogenase, mitochondrial-like isoform X2 [Nymphaea colorata]
MMSASTLSVAAQRLKGKVAIITGAASGIGLGAAKLFNRHGANVIIADIQDELGLQVCRELSSNKDGSIEYIHCDVTSEDDIRRMVDRAMNDHGKLDIMFSNAGIVDMSTSKLLQFEKSTFERIINVNLVGMFLAAKHAARVMIPAKRGSILFTASTASLMGGVCDHAYCSSKHAVAGLTKSMAAELGAFGIRVNCISPWAVRTPQLRRYSGLDDEQLEAWFGRFSNLKGLTLEAEDIAEAALYLASDESKYVSGHNLAVDGGCSVMDSGLNMFREPLLSPESKFPEHS